MRAFSLAFVLIAVLAAGRAHADDSEKVFIEKGLSLRRDHRDVEALEQFRRAHDIHPSPRTRAQIALAEQAIGRWADAEQDLSAALAETSDRWIVEHAEALRRALEVVRNHLGSVALKANVDGAEVWLNGNRIGPLPMGPLRVPGGKHRFEIRLAGYEPAWRSIELTPGTAITEEIEL